MSKYAVSPGALSGEILVGELNSAGDAFKDKEPLTDMVIAAVAEYVVDQYEGSMEATYPVLGFKVVVTVTPIGA